MTSNLQIAADAPVLIRAAAGAALVLHIGGGATGIASGWTAMLARKGGRIHRVAGTVFFVAMLTMSGVAMIVAPMLAEARWTNTTAAVFTFYLTATAWATVKRRAGEIGRFEVGALLVPMGIVAMGLVLAATNALKTRLDGDPTVFAIAVLAGLAAVCDLRMIRRGGVSGAARVARHLWRMSLALFVATGSFFLGQPKFVPAFLKETGLNAAPVFAILALLAFWMVRVRFTRAFRPSPATA